MTSQNGEIRHRWRSGFAGAMAGSAIAAALVGGFGAPTAASEPASPTTEAEAPPTPTMTADQALAIIQSEYDTGAGGGQVSNLIHDVLALRNQGFKPSKANTEALQEALDKRPHQTPLVEALTATVTYQRKIKAQAAMAQQAQEAQPGFAIGEPPAPMEGSGVTVGGPGGSISQPIG
jgi:hypothetical protein